VIGAATGPGSSSQWISGDLFAPGWTAGLIGGRIRWEDEAYYFQTSGNTGRSHDVSLYGGVRASRDWNRIGLRGELLYTRRLNYLFSTSKFGYAFDSAFDVRNTTLNFDLSYRY
jgi:hypothetical protein